MIIFKKLCAVLGCVLITTSLFTACENAKKKLKSSTAQITATPNNEIKATPTKNRADFKGELSVLLHNKDEAPNIIRAFNVAYPNVKIKLSVIPDHDSRSPYSTFTSAVRSGTVGPDVLGVESAHIKRLINIPDGFADLTQRAKDYIGNMVPYTVDVATDKNGELKALTYQAAVGALAYKKPVAKKYLGTDDSRKIAEMMSTQEKMLDTAKILKEKSVGKVALFPTFEEPLKLYLGGRSKGWVVDNKLIIDQKMIDFIDFAKTLRNNKYEASLDQWSPGWSRAIDDDETALAWLCPTWGIPWIVGSNDKDAYVGGRWGLAKPPFPYFWGGTWLGMYAKSTKQDLAWEFIKFFTTDKDAMKKWAAQNQDFPNNLQLISEGSSEDNEIMGTDVFKFFEPFVKDINGKLITKYDETIENAYTDCMRSYLGGKIRTKEEMLTTFKDKVKINLIDVKVE